MVHYKLTYESVTPVAVLPLTQKDWKAIGEIVKLDIQRGIMNQVDAEGKSYPALAPATVKRKLKPHRIDHPGQMAIPAEQDDVGNTRYIARFPEKRLIDGGNLLMNQVIAAFPDRVELTIGSTRIDVARWQIEKYGTNFWGVSKTAAQNMLTYVGVRVDKWLRETVSTGKT